MHSTHPLERFIAILAALACVVITAGIWSSVSAYQGMWPLPALYLIEMAALSVLAAAAFILGGPRGKFITWAAAGVFLAFSILGAFSIGFLYLPTTLMFAIISVTYDVRNKQNILPHLGVFLIGAIMQAAMMLAVIRLL